MADEIPIPPDVQAFALTLAKSRVLLCWIAEDQYRSHDSIAQALIEFIWLPSQESNQQSIKGEIRA